MWFFCCWAAKEWVVYLGCYGLGCVFGLLRFGLCIWAAKVWVVYLGCSGARCFWAAKVCELFLGS